MDNLTSDSSEQEDGDGDEKDSGQQTVSDKITSEQVRSILLIAVQGNAGVSGRQRVDPGLCPALLLPDDPPLSLGVQNLIALPVCISLLSTRCRSNVKGVDPTF